MSINFKLTPIKLKNGKTFMLEEIDSVYFPDDVWNNIKSFLPRPVAKTAKIIKKYVLNHKQEHIEIFQRSLITNTYVGATRDSKTIIRIKTSLENINISLKPILNEIMGCPCLNSKSIYKQGILQEYLFESVVKFNPKLLIAHQQKYKRNLKFGNETRFENSKKNYIKRKELLKKKLVKK